MGERREARKLAIRVLYTIDTLDIDREKAWNIVDTGDYSKKINNFAGKLVDKTVDNLEFIDKVILDNTENWSMDRIANVDKAIIRVGLGEIYYIDSIPRNVSINEAVELAKYFSTEKSHKFVNGILDTSTKDLSDKKNSGDKDDKEADE